MLKSESTEPGIAQSSVSFAPVSVIIPCYRCAETIWAAVESVLNQTLKPLEIILIEDCSDDGRRTIEALDEIKRSSSESVSIKILKAQKNRGAGESRNKGWEASSSTFLAFLDSDDTWHPKKLEVQTTFMLANPDVVMSCHGSLLRNTNKFDSLNFRNAQQTNISLRKLLFKNDIATRTVMLRRDIEYRFPRKMRHSEDYELWLRLLLRGHQAVRICMPLAFSYKEDFGDGGLSGDLEAMHKSVIKCFKKLYREQLISLVTYVLAVAFENIKYGRRLIMTQYHVNVEHVANCFAIFCIFKKK